MSAVCSGPVIAAAIAPVAGPSSHGLTAKAGPEMPALPAGFPSILRAEMAWTGSDFDDRAEIALVLRPSDIAEINAAVASYKCMGMLRPMTILHCNWLTNITQPWVR